MLGLERNKSPDLSEKERNTSYLHILDDRKHGRSARIPLFYNINTGDYLEPPMGFLDSPFTTIEEFYESMSDIPVGDDGYDGGF